MKKTLLSWTLGSSVAAMGICLAESVTTPEKGVVTLLFMLSSLVLGTVSGRIAFHVMRKLEYLLQVYSALDDRFGPHRWGVIPPDERPEGTDDDHSDVRFADSEAIEPEAALAGESGSGG